MYLANRLGNGGGGGRGQRGRHVLLSPERDFIPWVLHLILPVPHTLQMGRKVTPRAAVTALFQGHQVSATRVVKMRGVYGF